MRNEEALVSYDRALALNSNYAEALCNRGCALQELKRFEEALASYERALLSSQTLPMRFTIVATRSRSSTV